MNRVRHMGFEPADFVVMGFGLVVAVIGFAHRDRLPDPTVPSRFLLVALGYAGVLRLMARRDLAPTPRALVRSVALSSLIPYMFLQLGYVLPHVVDRTYERELALADRWLFGREPLAALEPLLHPLVTDALQASYVMYYPLFLCGLFLLARPGVRTFRQLWDLKDPRYFREFYMFMTAVALVQCGTYLGYFAVPAMSPYRAASDPAYADLFRFGEPVWGRYVQPWLGAWVHDNETCILDCFPSGHTAGALVVLLGMWKWRRPVFWAILPVQVALIAATVYLRYHYVVDVLAGAAWGVAALAVSVAWNQRMADGNEERADAGEAAREVAT